MKGPKRPTEKHGKKVSTMPKKPSGKALQQGNVAYPPTGPGNSNQSGSVSMGPGGPVYGP